MRVLLIGAHHGLGAQVLQQAAGFGIAATAFEGDALEATAVSKQLQNHDAVVSTLGPRRGAPIDLCSRGTGNLIGAMREQGKKRLVVISGAMIGHRRDRLGLFYRVMVHLAEGAMMADRRWTEEMVRESGLAWTLIRPTRLTDGPALGAWRDGADERVLARAHISRADAAQAILRALTDPATICRALTLQY